jgi:hypothetical protein
VRVALATTVHDPGGYLLPGACRASAALRNIFGGVAVSASTATHGDVLEALCSATAQKG